MLLEGTLVGGTVILDQPSGLPEGTRVEVVVKPSAEGGKPTLLGLLKLAGAAKDLPPDFAAEHDHYIHGTPRRIPSS